MTLAAKIVVSAMVYKWTILPESTFSPAPSGGRLELFRDHIRRVLVVHPPPVGPIGTVAESGDVATVSPSAKETCRFAPCSGV